MRICFRAIFKCVAHHHMRSAVHPTLAALIAILSVLCIAAQAQSPPSDAPDPDYKLGAEDAVAVTVLDHPEYSGEFYIPQEGTVDYPGVGRISVKGCTLQETAKLIRTGLLKRLREPEVFAILRSPRPLLVHVMGSVNRPGPYSVKPDWRIREAISSAGGLDPGISEDECTVTVRNSKSGSETTAPLAKIMRGNAVENKVLQPGDVVMVDSPEMIPVYVTGKVNRPGLCRIRKDSEGLLSALAQAGGATQDGSLTKVTVTHINGQTETVDVTPSSQIGKSQAQPKLHASDLITVPESDSRVAIMGAVAAPGIYTLKENQPTTLSDVLAMARGPESKRSSLNRVSVLRSINGKQERTVYDFTKFLKSSDIAHNPQMQPGDIVYVPQNNSPTWETIVPAVGSALSIVWMGRDLTR